MKRCLLVMFLLALCVSSAWAQLTAEQLIVQAKARRAETEADLTKARQRHLAERKVLAAELQKAYDDLATARNRAKKATGSLGILKAGVARLGVSVAHADNRIRSAVVQAASVAGVDVKLTDSIESMEGAIWAGFQHRLDAIESDMTVTTRSAPIVGRDGNDETVPVIRFGAYATYACGDARESIGLLESISGGRMRVVGPYLDGASIDNLRAATGEGGMLIRLPVDVDGSLRDRAPAEPRTIKSWLKAGGLFVYPIIIVALMGIILILERFIYLVRAKPPVSLVSDALAAIGSGDTGDARKLLASSGTPAGRVLLAGVDSLGKSDDQREAAIESALLAEAPKLERSLSLLAALAGVAPLLGLLGTVSGMITTFDTISVAGTGNPRLLSGGISEALITTQLGLMVAIPLLLAHAGLRRWVERQESMLEHDAIRIAGVERNDGEEKEETT